MCVKHEMKFIVSRRPRRMLPT